MILEENMMLILMNMQTVLNLIFENSLHILFFKKDWSKRVEFERLIKIVKFDICDIDFVVSRNL